MRFYFGSKTSGLTTVPFAVIVLAFSLLVFYPSLNVAAQKGREEKVN